MNESLTLDFVSTQAAFVANLHQLGEQEPEEELLQSEVISAAAPDNLNNCGNTLARIVRRDIDIDIDIEIGINPGKVISILKYFKLYSSSFL